ncbi:MAG TPA: hypothetical protein VIJ85_01120 [Rhizomicrobium sp.]
MSRPHGGWRQLVLAISLIAFALQSYLTQTHIHFATSQAFGISSNDTFVPAAKHGTEKTVPAKNAPSNDDPNCPICQAAMHSGQFVTPSAVAFILPSEAASIVLIVTAVLTANRTISHSWQGRAPPRV